MQEENGKGLAGPGGGDSGDDRTVHEPEIVPPLQEQALARLDPELPSMLFVVPVSDNVLFPGLILPLVMAEKRDLATLEQARSQSPFLGIVTVRPKAEAEPETSVLPRKEDDPGFFDIGCVGKVAQVVNLPEGRVGVMVAGVHRMRISSWVRTEPVLVARVDYPDELLRDAREAKALEPQLRQAFIELISSRPDLPDELARIAATVEGPARLTDFVAAHLGLGMEDRQALLATFEIDARLRRVILHLEQELDLARLGQKVRGEIREKMEQQQREFYLREQLKAIRRELGEELDEKQIEVVEYERKIDEAKMPPDADKRARYELKRLSVLPQEAAEYHVIRTYLDWLVELPWSRATEDNEDVARAEAILDEDHHGLEEVKRRIVEFLAVRKLKPEREGAILCLVGPPGVGKTSLGQSVARAMNRRFHRISLGGMRDEAEIKGHRRTYVGALPGRILQGLRTVETRNPVFMLDEIDKLGSDWRGDPSSAMLEVLDPAQNHAFVDHYLEVPFDLSHVMFIATANYAGQIPRPLFDRMEVIEIPGYIPDEKLAIAAKYLLPRQIEAHGLGKSQIRFSKAALAAVILGYTRESGVRELERRLGAVCRRHAASIAKGEADPRRKLVITPKVLAEILGKPRFHEEVAARVDRPGVAVGLAWTPFGGDILFIEATSMAGRGRIQVTGRLGEVMSESAQIAMSVVRTRAEQWGIDPKTFLQQDLHIHVPEGAVPKDGPSAGITLATALVSLLADKGKGLRVRAHLAMTGELTLRGTVLPVGGIREKTVAAKRAGIRTLILSRQNEPDVEELPARVSKGIRFVFVNDIEEVLRSALPRFHRGKKA